MDWNDPMEPYEPDYSKSRIRFILITIAAVIGILITVFFLMEKKKEERLLKMRIANTSVECDFSDFVVTDAYLEGVKEWIKRHPNTRYKKPEHAKLAVFFYYPNIPNVQTIEYIRLTGPNGYKMDVNLTTPYDRDNLNGYMDDGRVLWFQAYDVSGFLKEGNYIIEIKYKSGKKFSRTKTFRSNHELLRRFKETRKNFTPIGEIPENEINRAVRLKWTAIPDTHAFYCVRLARYYHEMSFARTSDLLYFDNIFFAEPGVSGLNKNQADINVELEKNVLYTWFVEIVDSNEFPKVNLVIYQNFQYFKIK